MRVLEFGVGLSDLRARLAQPEAELTEQALTLSHLQLHAEFAPEKLGQRWPIPHLRRKAELRGTGTQRRLHLAQLLIIQAAGSTWSFAFRQTGQALRFEALHPVYDRARRVTQERADLWTGQTLGDQQNSVQSMVVARGIVAANLILQCHDHVFLVRDRQCFHSNGLYTRL